MLPLPFWEMLPTGWSKTLRHLTLFHGEEAGWGVPWLMINRCFLQCGSKVKWCPLEPSAFRHPIHISVLFSPDLDSAWIQELIPRLERPSNRIAGANASTLATLDAAMDDLNFPWPAFRCLCIYRLVKSWDFLLWVYLKKSRRQWCTWSDPWAESENPAENLNG